MDNDVPAESPLPIEDSDTIVKSFNDIFISPQDVKAGAHISWADEMDSTTIATPTTNTTEGVSTVLEPATIRSENLNQNGVKCQIRAADMDGWRNSALGCLTNSSRGVFVLEAYTLRHVLLQIKLSTKGTSMFVNTLPWSLVDGRSLGKSDFEKSLRKNDREARMMLGRDSEEFSPSTLVRFILNHCNGVPAIVSSNYSNLMGRDGCRMRFVEYFVYQKILPGSQCCQYRDCTSYASAVRMDENFEPSGIYCTKHTRRMGIDNNVLLYNPLLVAFTAHKNNAVLSALNLEMVYGLRGDSGLWSHVDKPKSLPQVWTPLCKKEQPKQMKAKTSMDMMCETAKNVLDCANEHLTRGKHHNVGVVIRHSLTCCLLKAFVDSPSVLCTIPRWGGRVSEEDVPYNWKEFHGM